MQAIATKELRSRMRGNRAFVVLTLYLMLLSCLVIAVYGFVSSTAQDVGGPPPPLGRILFYAVTLIELLLIAPLAPAFGAASIAGERERQTFDLVMTTPVSAAAFILGKLASNLSYALLLIFVALPVQVLALLFGGLTLTEVLLGFWVLTVAAIFYACSSLYFSATARTTTTATVFSYLMVAASLIGAVFIFLVIGILGVGNGGFGFFGGPSGPPEPWAIYLSLFLISLSPLTAGGVTAAALVANEGTFIIRIPKSDFGMTDPGDLVLLSPWVIYTLIYLGLAALFVWLSIRSVRPTRARRPESPARPPGYSAPEVSL